MDPDKAWATVLDEDTRYDERAGAAEDLRGWLETGGFYPERVNAMDELLPDNEWHFHVREVCVAMSRRWARWERQHLAVDAAHNLNLCSEGFCLTCGWEPED